MIKDNCNIENNNYKQNDIIFNLLTTLICQVKIKEFILKRKYTENKLFLYTLLK